jgi:putative ABC transport system substrate-binding protein
MTRSRRDLIALLGSTAAVSWPLNTRAQQPEGMRRVGILMPLTAEDAYDQARLAAFLQGLQQDGWSVGRNLRIDTRWGGGDVDRIHRLAGELVALQPDVILGIGTNTAVSDPVGGGMVDSLSHPGGKMTGFSLLAFSTSAKWVELLKEVSPRVTRAAVLRDTSPGGIGAFGAIQAVAPSLGIETNPVGVHSPDEIKAGITAFARSSDGGLIVVPNATAIVHRELIISLAAQLHLPAVYGYRLFVTNGGLICYGPDMVDQCRRAAAYAARILKGEKPADLPVQEPTKYELVINSRTAKALGLTVPHTLLARADEVLE